MYDQPSNAASSKAPFRTNQFSVATLCVCDPSLSESSHSYPCTFKRKFFTYAPMPVPLKAGPRAKSMSTTAHNYALFDKATS